jgi:UDP-N-acetylglucosamine transferase subunit ALG13
LIFVTVGAQMSFDRLIGWVDAWAEANDRDDVCAQTGPSAFTPRRVTVLPFMDPPAFRRQMNDASAIVAHAGMGTILSALELGKPILVVPRQGSLSETRNDHQVATARRLEADGLVIAAYDEAQFAARMNDLEHAGPRDRIGDRADDALLARLRDFVLGEGGAT